MSFITAGVYYIIYVRVVAEPQLSHDRERCRAETTGTAMDWDINWHGDTSDDPRRQTMNALEDMTSAKEEVSLIGLGHRDYLPIATFSSRPCLLAHLCSSRGDETGEKTAHHRMESTTCSRRYNAHCGFEDTREARVAQRTVHIDPETAVMEVWLR